MSRTSPAGWHSRAVSYPHEFTPEKAALRLAVLRNAPAEPDGFTLALFDSPAKIAVDAAGKVLELTEGDFNHLIPLAEHTKDLPSTETFRNTWVVAQPITSRPIDRILLPVDGIGDGLGYKETSIRGFDDVNTKLRTPVGEYQDLPPLLQDLVKLALEAREPGDGDRDDGMINQVRGILGNVF